MDEHLSLKSLSKPTVYRRQNLKCEECEVNNERIKIPEALCENRELFKGLFSVQNWNTFTDSQRRHLMQFLPNFPENEVEEKSNTLKLLFSGGEFRFGSNPMLDFCDKLNSGFYRSDIVNVQKLIKKAKYREYLKRRRMYSYNILKHSVVMRQKVLDAANDLAMGEILPAYINQPDSVTVKKNIDGVSLHKRVKHRYYQELISIKKETGYSSDSSIDDNYPEGFVPPPFTKKHRKQICQLEGSFNAEFDQPVISTLSRPDCLDLSRLVLNIDNPFDMTDDKYQGILKQYRKRRKTINLNSKYEKGEGVNDSPKPKRQKPDKIKKPRKKREKKVTVPKKLSSLETVDEAIEAIVKNEISIIHKNETNTETGNSSKFAENSEIQTKEIATDELKQTISQKLEKVTNCVSVDESILSGKNKFNEESVMKDNQDRIVGGLLSSDQHKMVVDEYINDGDKSPVIIFDNDVFNTKTISTEKSIPNYLLTPESYNIALQSVVHNASTSQFEKAILPDVDDKSTIINTHSILEDVDVDNLTFDPITIDTITESDFTNVTPVAAVISTNEDSTRLLTISPSVTDFDSMNLMDLGHLNEEIMETSPTIKEKPPIELIHNAHSNFFSLIREIVCSTCDHRMDLLNLQKRIDSWYENPVSPLNDWYTYQIWPSLLQNAVIFLTGHYPDILLPTDYVPYIEYKSDLDIYQWIGAGRDSDMKLNPLCDIWLKNKDLVATKTNEDKSAMSFSPQNQIQPYSLEMKIEFRKQEKLRFKNPKIPFIYRLEDKSMIVGPINFSYASTNSDKTPKGCSLLLEDRPHYVTIVALVQDAVARLPNGEGSLQDIVTLLKESQYISSTILNYVLHGTIASILEKLQIDINPCVKYDNRSKLWIYLHRSKSINDFGMRYSSKSRSPRRPPPAWKIRKDQNQQANNRSVNVDSVNYPMGIQNAIKGGGRINSKAVKNLNIDFALANSGIRCEPADNTEMTKIGENVAHAAQLNGEASEYVLPEQLINPPTAKTSNTAAAQQILDCKDETTQPSNCIPKIMGVQQSLDKSKSPILRTAHIKSFKATTAKSTRPTIIKKPIVKNPNAPIQTIKSNVVDAKSILTNTNKFVKLINTKSLKSNDQGMNFPHQQIMVIKQQRASSTDDCNKTKNTDIKKTTPTILLKPLPNGQRIHISNIKGTKMLDSIKDKSVAIGTTPFVFPVSTSTSTLSSIPRVAVSASNSCSKEITLVAESPHVHDGSDKTKNLQQFILSAVANNKLKSQEIGQQLTTATATKVTMPVATSTKPNFMVVKQSQSQQHNASAKQNTFGGISVGEANGITNTSFIVTSTTTINTTITTSTSKVLTKTAPLVILNSKTVQGSKPQIIQLGSSSLQQMILKQQSSSTGITTLKNVTTQNAQATKQSSPHPQQILMLKSTKQDGQTTAHQGQQIVMLKHLQQQLPQTNQKIQLRPPTNPHVVQIATSGTSSLTAKSPTTSNHVRIQKLPVSAATLITQNSKAINTPVVTSAPTNNISKSLPSSYTVVVGAQQQMFSQNNQSLQIITSTSPSISTSNINNINQKVVLPTSTTGLTPLLQSSMPQVLLPANFSSSSGTINLKSIQGLKMIPISTQSTNATKGQHVLTRLVNSCNVRPVVMLQDDKTKSIPTSSSSSSTQK